MNEDLQVQIKDLGETRHPDALPPSITPGGVERLANVKRQGNTYVKLTRPASEKDGQEAVWTTISNFVVELLGDEMDVDHPETQDNLQRHIRLLSHETSSWEGVVAADVIADMRQFERLIASKGDFHWYGHLADFKRIWHMATQTGREARKRVLLKSIIGRDDKTGAFLAGNGAVDLAGNISRKDGDGLIGVEGLTYRIAPRDTGATNGAGIPIFDFETNEVDACSAFSDVVQKCQKLWGAPVELLWGWGLAHAFRSRWMDECFNFPVAMVASPPDSGKNSLMTMFVNLYGLPFSPISLGGLSAVGLLTQVNMYRDIPAWIDEFKNSANAELLELFKSNYDGSSKVVGTLDPMKTKSRKHRTGLVITGEFRAIDTALNQRCILVNLQKQVDPESLIQARAQSRKLSAYLVDVLKRQTRFWDDMFATYGRTLKEWNLELNGSGEKVDIRIIENYAKVYAALDSAFKDGKREGRFLNYMLAKVVHSGDNNPAVEALKHMPRFIAGAIGPGHKGWISAYIDLKKNIFRVKADELGARYCDYARCSKISTDDLFKYAMDAHLVRAIQPRDRRGAVKTYRGAPTTTQGSVWVLDMSNSLVRDVAEELAPFFTPVVSKAQVKEVTDAPLFGGDDHVET